MGDVTRLPVGDATPADVIAGLSKRSDIADVYAIVRDTAGKFQIYASGDLDRMSDAALIFLRRATGVATELKTTEGET